MEILSEPISGNYIELYYSGFSRPLLTKVVFNLRKFPRPRVSLRSNRSSITSEAYFTFSSSRAATAMGLLFVKAAKENLAKVDCNISIVSGGPRSLASELAKDLADKKIWLLNLFGDLNSDSSFCPNIFHHGQCGRVTSVILDRSFLESTAISIILNECPLVSVAQLSELETAIWNQDSSFQNTPKLKNAKIIPLYSSVLTDDVRHSSLGEVAPRVIDIFSKKILEEQLIKNGIADVRTKIDELSSRELAYHISHHTEIDLVNANRDWKISFEFEVINAGFLPITKRTHQYWFEQPQAEIPFHIYDENGDKINYTLSKSSEKYREIVLELPKELNALDRIKYKITYQVKGISKQDSFFYLSPRTITKALSLTIKGYSGFKFDNYRVGIETEGGFHKDDPPSISLHKENGVEQIRWCHRSPRPGELFRTFWSNANNTSPTKEIPGRERMKLVTTEEKLETQ